MLVGTALDPPRRELAEIAAHPPVAAGSLLHVVLAAPKLELAGRRAHRPGRAAIAVERHADAARVHEQRLVRPRSAELEMGRWRAVLI